MLIEKIRRGVLEIQTEKGLRYVRPSFKERIRLLWTFRNFQLLPQKVLTQREVALVAALLERGRYQRSADCRIGIIEWAPPPLPPDPDSSARLISNEAAETKPLPAVAVANGNRRSRRRRNRNRGQNAPGLQVGMAPVFTARPR